MEGCDIHLEGCVDPYNDNDGNPYIRQTDKDGKCTFDKEIKPCYQSSLGYCRWTVKKGDREFECEHKVRLIALLKLSTACSKSHWWY